MGEGFLRLYGVYQIILWEEIECRKTGRVRKSLTGEVFGNLLVLAPTADKTESRHTRYFVFCAICSEIKPIVGTLLTRKCRPIIACCGRSRVNIRHGHCSKGKRSPTYVSWVGIKNRTQNPKASNYKYYGAIGIRMCKAWATFEGFLKSVGARPEGTTIGRYGDIGNYVPSNTSWMDRKQQDIERRKKLKLKKKLA